MTKKIYLSLLVFFTVCLISFGSYALIRYDGFQQKIQFSEITNIAERKEAFFNFLQPRIEVSNQKILTLRNQVERLKNRYQKMGQSLTSKEIKFLNTTARTYKIRKLNLDENGFARLLKKIDIVPPSLAVAQAAKESAWGTSRFAVKGNNYFGQWCFSKGCGLVPSSRTKGATHEVARFDSAQQSVQQYMFNINTHKAYRSLRGIRENLRNSNKQITGLPLSEGLTSYSERGDAYINEIQAMIKHNNLLQLDFKSN